MPVTEFDIAMVDVHIEDLARVPCLGCGGSTGGYYSVFAPEREEVPEMFPDVSLDRDQTLHVFCAICRPCADRLEESAFAARLEKKLDAVRGQGQVFLLRVRRR